MSAFTPGPYELGRLRTNDGALPILAPADPEEFGSDRRRIALIDPSIDMKRGTGWKLTDENDPEQMATARVLVAAPDQHAVLNYVADMTYCGADGEWHFKPGYNPQRVLDAIAKATSQ